MHGSKIKWFLLLGNLTAGAEEFIKSKNKSYMYFILIFLCMKGISESKDSLVSQDPGFIPLFYLPHRSFI